MTTESPKKQPAPLPTKPPTRRGIPPAAKVPPTKRPRLSDEDEDHLEDEEDVDDVEEADDGDAPTGSRRRLFGQNFLHHLGSWSVSAVIHAGLLVAFALWLVPDATRTELKEIIASIITERPEEDLMKVELEERIVAAQQASTAAVSSSPEAGVVEGSAAGPNGGGGVSAPALDNALTEQLESATTGISIGLPLDGAPTSKKMIAAVPEGFVGDPRAVVDNYQEAMDRITQEIMWMLSKGKVLVVWNFDQSESMKDDQKEIRDRVERVYLELGLTKKTQDESLTTAVTSFGGDFAIHTKKPTGDLFEIRRAIDEVPLEPSGKEMLCQAVGKAIMNFRDYAKRTDRQMAQIIVTDESGDPETNNRYLEQVIAEAKAAQCRIYVLGREAVFGYPYAHIRWVHPQTRGVHWLQIDRGPETGFVEQLQTDGFHRRYDAHSSGFGPYEQVRMAQQTGGVFFMLPSVETNLVRGEKRRYELEAMRAYVPDMRSRMDVITERDKSHLRSSLWKIINDLNPYKPEISRIIEMRMTFSREPQDYVKQFRHEQTKAIEYLRYLALAEKEMNKLTHHREQEVSPRWQANYDLMYAQIIAYQARIYEYGAYLEWFISHPKTAAPTKPPNLTFVHWDIRTRKELVAPEKSQPYMDKAKVLFEAIIKEHGGTPWAARAEHELKRGFGVELIADYDAPRPVYSGTPIPVPKL